jgi:hypothetical protein
LHQYLYLLGTVATGHPYIGCDHVVQTIGLTATGAEKVNVMIVMMSFLALFTA